LPVESISWHDAQRFCTKLSERTGQRFRLPTEAEWEYACRAGSATLFSFGDVISTERANYDGRYTYRNSPRGVYRHKTTPAGTFPANAWGLCDMHGNVWEWCQDWFDIAYYQTSPVDDPPGPPMGVARVLRGGSCFYAPQPCRSAYRYYTEPTNHHRDYGCRVVMVREEE
jgi:formylglycine-generating enzyme required for sulfatase activity